MMPAWIIRRDIDAVRNEWDDYRNECADWLFEKNPRARALADRIAIDNITGQIVPNDPDSQKKIQEILQEEGSWHLRSWKSSGWNTLRVPRPQVAIDELWQAAGEGRIKATARRCENAKALHGDRIEIPAHYWPHLKRVDDPLTGKAMLSDGNGRVYREVQFPRLDAKELWPKAAENARIAPARKGRKPMYDWEDAMNFAKREFENRGDYNDPQNAVDGWRSQADLARLVINYMKKHNGGKEPSDSSVKSHLKDLLDSIRK
jgi:hypothetical protein